MGTSTLVGRPGISFGDLSDIRPRYARSEHGTTAGCPFLLSDLHQTDLVHLQHVRGRSPGGPAGCVSTPHKSPFARRTSASGMNAWIGTRGRSSESSAAVRPVVV